MSARSCVLTLLILSCVVAPIVIGASCPNASSPPYLYIGTNPSGARTIPACRNPNAVCISIVNEACVSIDAALYIHDGYDAMRQYVYLWDEDCFPRTDTDSPDTDEEDCCEPQVGELELPRTELFQRAYLTPITGTANTYTLAAGASIVTEIACEDVKSIGASVSQTTSANVLTNPEYRAGPEYRCQRNCDPDLVAPRDCDNIVPCGETIEFLVKDLNGCASLALTDLMIQDVDESQVSRVCGCQDAADEDLVLGLCENAWLAQPECRGFR